ncbi:hypothetical protein IKB17_05040 [bacterium]|nr:hypothetical protein [bacterium]
MSEINGHGISVNQLNYTGIQKQGLNNSVEPVETTEDMPQITDFSDSKAEALGRSMLFKGNDSINNDLRVLLENPQIAENSEKLFETAYTEALNAGTTNPYEEASTFATGAM